MIRGDNMAEKIKGDLIIIGGAEDKEGDKELRKQNKKRTGRNYSDYTGVIVFYRENGKDQKLTSGEQSNPLKLIKTYKTKKTATIALKREQARIDKAKKGK